ncbi:sugar transferase, partial [Planomonospora parontospora]
MTSPAALPPPSRLTRGKVASASPSPLRRHARLMFLVDTAAITLACLIELTRTLASTTVPEKITMGVVLCVMWPGAIALARGYEPRFAGVGPEEFRRVFQSAVTLIAVVATVAYATEIPFARGYVVVALPLATCLTLIGRHLLRKRLHRWYIRGTARHRVVAVGHRSSVQALITEFRKERHHGMTVVAACVPPFPAAEDELNGVPVAGDFRQVHEVVRHYDADAVAVLACPELDGVALRRLAWELENDDITLYVASALMEVAGPRTSIKPIAGLPLLHVAHPELTGYRQLLKNVFDRVVALTFLFVLALPMLAVALTIRLGDRGPAIFTQTRVGRGGREFRIYKFRTMVPDAETAKQRLSRVADGNGVLFKMRFDPRVTPVGGFLRRYSIDELP